MKKFVLASASAIALLGLAACSDATDETTTQSVPPAGESSDPNAAGTDNTTTQSIDPAPTTEPAPMQPAAPAQ